MGWSTERRTRRQVGSLLGECQGQALVSRKPWSTLNKESLALVSTRSRLGVLTSSKPPLAFVQTLEGMLSVLPPAAGLWSLPVYCQPMVIECGFTFEWSIGSLEAALPFLWCQ